MNDTLLLDAIERYRNGEMSPQEITFFEELRKNNPDIDQLAAEHNFFLGELDKLSEIKAFRHSLNEVENKLANEGIISQTKGKGKARIVYLWNRYRRTIAVAAFIAGLVSISTATIVSMYSEKKKVAVITPLVDHQINQINQIKTSFTRLKLSLMTYQLQQINLQNLSLKPTSGLQDFWWMVTVILLPMHML